MRIAKELAGFSGAKADDLRKAIGKKNRAAMAKLKPEFVAGARASGTPDSVIDFLWSTNEKSADYSFNRSHAACYALIAYRTAWLKANHPAEYMAAALSSMEKDEPAPSSAITAAMADLASASSICLGMNSRMTAISSRSAAASSGRPPCS